MDINSRLSKALYRVVKPPRSWDTDAVPPPEYSTATQDADFPLRLSIVIQVVGSRGEVQPFVALGNALQSYGHRIRLATHEKFCAFVSESGLEFFPIGGDPEDLMAYMVKNPGLVPSMKSLRAGDIAHKRKMIAEMLDGCWSSCIQPDPVTTAPFIADAIIANPPSFAHIHCAEALGIPVHIVFTMPWTSTAAFAHPLANVRNSSNDPKLVNYMTYALVGWMTWQGLGDVINAFRVQLDLEPVPATEGPVLAETLKIPHTYCWSSALVPKPKDWAAHIDVFGFFFREAPDYKPSENLQKFVEAGSPPIYIGFGSIVLDDPARFCSAILDAVAACEERAIISPGWSRMRIAADQPNILILDESPHEWLFQHVSMVVHHGGAGTTAIGLREARPTIIVPFFGDQPFWGNMVAAAGAGPEPIPQRQVTAAKLAEAIRFCQKDEVRTAAVELSLQIRQEDGVKAAVRSFHANLPLEKMRCALTSDQPASWRMKLGGKHVAVSRSAAEVLVQDVGLNPKNLKAYHPSPILITNRRWDPASGTVSSLMSTGAGMVDGATGIFLKPREELLRGKSRSPGLRNGNAPASASASRVRSTAVSTQGETAKTEQKAVAYLPAKNDMAVRDSTTKSEPTGSASLSTTVEHLGGAYSHEPSIIGDPNRPNSALVSSMVLASGKSLGKFFTSFTKGFLVDMPLATAEGFHAMPRLWGEEVRDHEAVVDWQSGGAVAGKAFVQGMSDGFRDAAMHPVRGAQSGGVLGAARGLATGTGSLMSNTVSAGLGLVAYPGQGIAKSLHAWTHGSTAKKVAEVRREEGAWMAEQLSEVQRLAIVDVYHDLQRKDN